MGLTARRPVMAVLLLAACLAGLIIAPLPVTSEATDATKSTAAGAGLQSATAGTAGSFTITAKDESGASRTSGGDNFIVELEGTRSISGSVVDQLDGSYQVTYTATKSGTYEASVKLAKSGGLSAAYYENVWFFFTPVKQIVDPMINMDWGTGLITATGADYISIRWTGKLKPQFSEAYTFFATTDDGSRLWVDNVPLIDRWDSFTNDTSATISLKANVFYNIKMEYKEVTGTAFAKLSWASPSTPKTIIPASQLYYETHILQSPFSLSVSPSVACASQSTAAGNGLAVATAGTAAQLTIQANDEYDNELGVGGSIFSVRVFPPTSQRPVHAVVVDDTDSSYSIEYTAFEAGSNSLQAELLSVGSLQATYYQTTTLSGASTTATVSQVSQTTAAGQKTDMPGAGGNEDVFSMRFQGFVKPTQDGIYTFLVDQREADSLAFSSWTLYVDNTIVQQRATVATTLATSITGTIDLRSSNYYNLKLDYISRTGNAGRGVLLQWGSGSTADLASTSMFSGAHIQASPFGVEVKPARTSAAKTTASDAAGARSLSLATAGVQAEFTVTARDLYNNLRGVGGENFRVRLTGVDSTAGVVQDLNNGQYRVTYTATQSGTYDISVVFGAGGINGSPFRLYVQPARRQLSSSVATGMALTLATAGVRSVMTLTVKDRFENWQPSPAVAASANIQFGLADSTAITTYIADSTCCTSNTCPVNSLQDDCPKFADSSAPYFVGVPTTNDKATFTIRYLITKSGTYQMNMGGNSKHDGPVGGSPFSLTVFPHLPCSTTSSANGNALTIVTAGLAGTFTIQSRDEHFNVRGSHVGDNFVSFVRQDNSAGLSDHPATVVDNADSTYTLSFVATRSTTNTLWAQLAYGGGMLAKITDATATSGLYLVTGLGLAGASNPNGDKVGTARFSGFFRPTQTGQYSFSILRGDVVNHGFSLNINNKQVVTAATNDGGNTGVSGSVALVGNRFYDVQIDYTMAATGHSFTVKYGRPTQAATTDIPTTSIFTSNHIAGSPFTLNVRPTKACATLSTKAQMAISLATAGVEASFTIQTKDEFGNNREISGDPFNLALMQGSSLPSASQAQDDSKDGGTLFFQGTTSYTSNGGYRINYVSTRQGRYELRGKILQSGGLYAEYFETDSLVDYGEGADGNVATLDPFNRVDAKIDFDWSDGSPVDPASAEFATWANKKKIGPDYFSARWTGLVKPDHTEVYTFSAEVDDGIRVWVDDLLIMDYWDVRSREVDGTIALMQNSLYSIKVEYRDVTGAAVIRFRWRSKSQAKQVVPSANFFHTTTSGELSQAALDVEPYVVCSSTSHAEGEGLTIATAGTTSYFTVQSRDEYNNKRKLGDEPDFHVRVIPVVSGLQRPYHAGLHDLSHAGINRIPSFDYPGGLTASYYVGATNYATCQERPWHDPLFCYGVNMDTFFQVSPTLTVGANDAFETRFKGFIRISRSGEHTFSLLRSAANAAVIESSFTINGATVIATTATNAAHSATFDVSSANSYHEIALTYKQANSHSAASRFKLQIQGGGDSAPYAIGTDRMFPLAGRYKVHYTPTVKGDYSVSAVIANPGSLDATFYDDQELTVPVAVTRHGSLDFSSVDYSDGNVPRGADGQGFGSGTGLSDVNSFSARWQGLLKVTQATSTFKVAVKETDERVKLWVDNSLLIDRWDQYNAPVGTLFDTGPVVVATGAGTYQIGGSTVALGSVNMYFDVKLEYKQRAGVAGVQLMEGNNIITSGNLYYATDISGSPFPPHEVMPAPTCATRSTVRGTGLTEATAGMANHFTIQSHDEFDNERGIGGDMYYARLTKSNAVGCVECPEYVYGTVVDEGDSSYKVSYLATKKGAYHVTTSLAKLGGLFATFYSDTVGTPASAADHNAALTVATATANHVYRWEGFIQPPVTGPFTFSMIDGDATWSSSLYLGNFSTPVTAATDGSNNQIATHTFATANSLYQIKLEFNRNGAGADPTVLLKWAYPGQSDVTVASDRLYSYADVPNAVDALTLFVEDTDAIRSHASGDGLTIATAGAKASFTVTAKDSYANERRLDEDTWLVQVNGPGISHTSRAVHDSTSANKAGSYHVEFMTTISGNYDVDVRRATTGGLSAEYFNNMWLMGTPAYTGVDKEIDFNWADGAVRPASAPSSLVLGSDYMSVRWSGYIMPELSEEYTFYTETDEGVRLFIDGNSVIDQWEATAANQVYSATWGGFIVGALYSIKMEYRESTDNAYARLHFSSDSIAKQAVPVDVLFSSSSHIFGSPFKMYAYPAITCAASSTVDGPGLSFGTTGNRASFTIQAKDQYHNVKTQWVADSTEVFVVRSRTDSHGDASKLGTVTHNVVKGKWNTIYEPTRCGANSIYVNMLDMQSSSGRGILATYYATTDLSGSPVSVGGAADFSFSDALAAVTATGTHFSARFAGMFKAAAVGEQTFSFEAINSATHSAGRVYVNNELVVDAWSTPSNSKAGTMFLPSTSEWYDLVVEYKDQQSGAQMGIKDVSTVMTTARLYRPLDVSNSPYQYITQPDVTAWTTSTISGEALTIATAGVSGQFTIQSKDLNNNNRDTGGDEYLMHAASATGSAFSGTITDNGDGSYIVKYTPSMQGAYTVKLYLGTSDMTTALHVEPGKTSATLSVANSNQLTIATAGHMATFTIQAKDEYKNLRTIESNDWIVRLSGPGSEEHNNPVRYIGGHPFNPVMDQLGKFETHFRTTQSGEFRVDVQLAEQNGLNAVYYRDETMTNAVLTTVDPVVSFNWGADSPNAAVGIVDGFSVAWSGYVKPDKTDIYSFFVAFADDHERVKLWVDDHYIIDQWAASAVSPQSGTIRLAANTLYDIKLSYKEISGNAEVELRWATPSASSTVVPSTRLFSKATHIAGSPFTATVFPSVTSGALSTVSGPGLTLSTAGITASFTVTAKDHLGNIKTTNNDVFIVRARAPNDLTVRDIAGTVSPIGDGRYSVVYTPTLKHHEASNKIGANDRGPFHDVLVSLADDGGLYATYFDTTNANLKLATAPFGLTVVTGLTGGKPTIGTTIAGDNQFVARYAGFIRPAYSELYTFQFTKVGAAEVALEIDGKEIFGTAATSGTMQFMQANHYYDIVIYYDNKNEGSPTLKLQYLSNSQSAVDVQSDRLFQRYDLTFKTFEEGALYATYYEDVAFSTPNSHARDPFVDWSGASTTDRPHPSTLPAAGGDWSARWEGFIRPSRRDKYTFSLIVGSGGANERAKLWVDPSNADYTTPLVDTVTATAASGTVQFPLENDVYDIRVDYNVGGGVANRRVSLLYENAGKTFEAWGRVAAPGEDVAKKVVPSDRLSVYRAKPTINRDDSTMGLWTFDANACLGVNSKTDEERWRECTGQGRRVNDILHVDVKPAVACATTSTIDMTAHVTLSTAGVQRSFEVVVRDEYGNLRDNFDQGITSRQVLQVGTASDAPFEGSVAGDPTSSFVTTYTKASAYNVFYTVTRSGEFWNQIALADAKGNGLFGTYFMTKTLSGGAVTRIDSDINFNWGRGAPTADGLIPADGFSVRWTGAVRAAYSEVYTFYVRSDDGVRLFVNGKTVIDQWAATPGVEHSGTVSMTANILHDISLEYKEESDNAFVEMRYASLSNSKELVPSSRLYPTSELFGNGKQHLQVHPTLISATTSTLVGDGLSIATAGVVATFEIGSKDMYGNLRDEQNAAVQDCVTDTDVCTLYARVVPDTTSVSILPRHATMVPHNIVDRHTFTGSYQYTRAGSHNIYSVLRSRTDSGYGLAATYYDDTAFAVPRKATIDDKVAISLVGAAVTPASLTDDALYSVRWSGMIKPTKTGANVFSLARKDSVKLWVEDVLIIDAWTAASDTQTGTITLVQNNLYDLRIEAKSDSAADTQVELSVEGVAVTGNTAWSDRVFSSHLISGEPKRLRVNPNIACATTSTHSGTGLSLTTAGVQAVATITAKDEYTNERGKGGDIFVSRAFPAACAVTSCSPQQFAMPGGAACVGCPNIVRSTVTDKLDNSYEVKFTPTKKGDYKVINSLATAGGLTATYYQQSNEVHADFTLNLVGTALSDGQPVDFSVTDATDHTPNAGQIQGAIRWHGFLKPSRASEYTFYLGIKRTGTNASPQQLRLWVDNSIVITATGFDANAATEVSGTIGFGSANGLYDVQVTYSYDSTSSALRGLTMQWESTGAVEAKDNQYKSRIRTDRMYSRHDVNPADVVSTAANNALAVHATTGCATKSIVTGDQLTLSTAGVASTFTITARDQYENDRTITSDMPWIATLHGSGGVPSLQANVAPEASQTYKVSYTVTAAKSYEIFAKHENQNAHGSPFALTVRPARECGSTTTATGTGLTAAVLNADAVFTVHSRDEFQNARTQNILGASNDVYLARAFFSPSTARPWTLASPQDVSGTTHTGVKELAAGSSDGKYTGTYRMTSVAAGNSAYVHASLAVKGGLLATFYDVGAACNAGSAYSAWTAKIVAFDTVVDVNNANACNAAAGNCASGATFSATSCFAARFAGYFKATQTTQGFVWTAPTGSEYHRLFVGGKVTHNSWAAPQAAAAFSTTVSSLTSGNYYDIFYEYRGAPSANKHIGMAIATTHLWADYEISGSPFDLTVTS